MKPSLVLLALCAGIPMLAQTPSGLLITSASGDSSISLYGVLDSGVARVNHTLGFDPYNAVEINPQATKAATSAATGMYNGGIQGTRWGLKGGTGIGEGWRAIFLLESGLNLPNGTVSNAATGMAQTTSGPTAPYESADSSINGQLFGRGAYFGVASEHLGTLTLGRQQSIMLDIIPSYDALQGAQLFTPIGFSGSYGGGGATDNSRVDNAIKYKAKFGDFNIGLLHKVGGTAGDANAKSAEQVNLGYESGPFGIQFVYEGFKDATSISNPYGGTVPAVPTLLGTIAITAFDTVSYSVAAKYQLDALAIKGGFQRQQFTNPSSPASDQQLTSLYSQVVSSVNVTPYSTGQKNLNVMWLGANYDVTSKFNVGASYYQVDQNDYSAGTQAAAGGNKQSGKSRFESALLDYKFTQSFDTYLGYMVNVVNGGMSYASAGTPFLCKNNSVLGLGARLSF